MDELMEGAGSMDESIDGWINREADKEKKITKFYTTKSERKLLSVSFPYSVAFHISMGECNTILSAYTIEVGECNTILSAHTL